MQHGKCSSKPPLHPQTLPSRTEDSRGKKMSDESYPDYRMAGSPPGRQSGGEVYSLHPGEGQSPWDLERVGREPVALRRCQWCQGASGWWGDEGGGGEGRKRKKVGELSRCYILSSAIM